MSWHLRGELHEFGCDYPRCASRIRCTRDQAWWALTERHWVAAIVMADDGRSGFVLCFCPGPHYFTRAELDRAPTGGAHAHPTP